MTQEVKLVQREEMVLPQVDKKGFLATLLGGVVGGSIGLAVGGTLGFAVIEGGLDDLYGVFILAAIGAWLGGVAGAYLGLLLVKADAIRRTTAWVALLAPPIVGGGAWVAVSATDSDDFGSNWLPYLLFGLCVVTTAYLARRLAVAETAGVQHG
ncbi:MAG: hypothetical protein M3N53_14015 [Actinomycetota bacterium]|nr:hypothetical protein [Actinomycetota bacterium]